jgi:hypothetical protein
LKPSDFRVLEDGIPQKLSTFAEGGKSPLSAAKGARRGEVLALRWTDVQNGEVICRDPCRKQNEGWPSKAPKPTRIGRSPCPSRSSPRSQRIALPKMLSESSSEQTTGQT